MPSHRPPLARTPQAALLGLLLAASAIVGGCAVPGEPAARHPAIPEAVKDLTAHQQGDAVVLSFTLPKNSTDQKPLSALPTVEVYRATSSTSAPAPSSRPSSASEAPPSKLAPRLADTIPSSALETYQKNGHTEFPDPLDPAAMARNPGQQVTYFIRTRVSAKRESASSNAVAVPVFPAPQAISDLRATVTQDAILLSWTPAPVVAPLSAPTSVPIVIGYRVYRAEVAAEITAKVAPTAATVSAAQSSSQAAPPTPIELLGQPERPEYRDTTFELDHSYSYVVRSITQFGSVIVESADSAPLIVLAKDVFAPAAPQGLETVIVPETAGVSAYVELAWNISPEPDLAGYAVFRSEQSDTPGERLTSELLSAPTFRDMTTVPGRHYFYRVAAVDRDGNVSPLSSAAEADVP